MHAALNQSRETNDALFLEMAVLGKMLELLR